MAEKKKKYNCNNYDKYIQVRATAEEKKRLKNHVEKKHVSMSSFIRDKIKDIISK